MHRQLPRLGLHRLRRQLLQADQPVADHHRSQLIGIIY